MGRTACTEPQCLYKGALYLLCTFVTLPDFLNRRTETGTATRKLRANIHSNIQIFTQRHVWLHETSLYTSIELYLCYTLSWPTALEGGEWTASRPGRSLPPGKTRYPLYRRLGGSQGRSGRVRKISPPTGIRSPDRPARSQSLYRLGYQAHLKRSTGDM